MLVVIYTEVFTHYYFNPRLLLSMEKGIVKLYLSIVVYKTYQMHCHLNHYNNNNLSQIFPCIKM